MAGPSRGQKEAEPTKAKSMWKQYAVELEFTAQFGASLPKNLGDIRAMLENRMPSEAAHSRMDDPTPVEELVEQVAEEVGATEEAERGWLTFKRDDDGIYAEARTIRGHLKDCAQQITAFLEIRGLKPKVANKVYVEPAKLRPTRPDGTVVKEVDGTETRMIHVMTPRGFRNDVKYVDYVNPPCRLAFTLKVLNDGVVGREILEAMFEYGGTHGYGAERSQQWGQYELKSLTEPEAEK